MAQFGLMEEFAGMVLLVFANSFLTVFISIRTLSIYRKQADNLYCQMSIQVFDF